MYYKIERNKIWKETLMQAARPFLFTIPTPKAYLNERLKCVAKTVPCPTDVSQVLARDMCYLA